ncbi:MAG: class II glutamine amidotransferase [Actinomycetota bacterium]
MCELLAASFVVPTRLGPYLERFRARAAENREGWGIAWWRDGGPEIHKEPIPADESALAARLVDEHPASAMFLVHVRAATIGERTLPNTHPWAAPALGRTWVFAHNGTVRALDRLDLGDRNPTGDTDSERAFLHLLTRLEAQPPESSDDAAGLADAVHAVGRELSTHDSRVNFLCTDGTTLFAYHDGHKTLHLLERSDGVIVASVPLTDEPGWTRLAAGAFVVVAGGRLVARSDGD